MFLSLLRYAFACQWNSGLGKSVQDIGSKINTYSRSTWVRKLPCMATRGRYILWGASSELRKTEHVLVENKLDNVQGNIWKYTCFPAIIKVRDSLQMAVWLIAGLEEYLGILVTADSTYKPESYNCLHLFCGEPTDCYSTKYIGTKDKNNNGTKLPTSTIMAMMVVTEEEGKEIAEANDYWI